MGTTTQKLEYLGTTKSQLKDQINYGLPTEKQITNQTTFREYVGSIFEAFLEALRNPDTLFTNLPKTSGSGSNITLNNTANAPMRITLNPTAISQDGTPTPSSPQDIHTISGNNSVVVEGKNLIGLIDGTYTSNGITAIVNNGKITLNGTASGTSFIQILLISEINLLNQTITLSANNSTTGGDNLTEMRLYTSGSSYLPCTYNIVDNSVIYTNKTDTYVRLQIRTSSGISYNNFALKPMLEKGNSKTDYEPYNKTDYPLTLGDLEYSKIGNYEDEFVRSGGENLLNKEIYELGKFIGANGEITSNVQNFLFSDYANVEPNTTYTISANTEMKNFVIAEYNGNKTWLKNTTKSVVQSASFTTDSNTKYVRVSCNYNYQAITKEIIDKLEIILNKGTTALPYVPYEKGWYYKQGIGKVVLDGTESWGTYSSSSSRNVYSAPVLTNSDNYSSASTIPNILLDRFNVVTQNASWVVGNASRRTQAQNYLYLTYEPNTTETDFKTWLSTHNTILYYVLDTPTYTKITGELAQELEEIYKGMLSYDGTTNISQVNNDLAFVINASAITK